MRNSELEMHNAEFGIRDDSMLSLRSFYTKNIFGCLNADYVHIIPNS